TYANPTTSTINASGSSNTNTGSIDNSNTSGSIGNVSDLLGSSGSGQSSSGTSTSAIDLINAIANPDAGSTTATGTPVALNGSLQNDVALNANGQSNLPASGTVYSLNPGASQTFVSQDLSQSPINTYAPVAADSTFGVL